MTGVWLRAVSISAISMGLATAACSGASATDLPSNPQIQLVVDVSPAARDTRPIVSPDYSDPRAMLENADMAAFMLENRELYASGERSESWGFAAIDMLSAGQSAEMKALVDAMPKSGSPGRALTQQWLKPWALAANGEPYRAVKAMRALEDELPAVLFRGHLALLMEGLGWHDDAVKAYDVRADELTLPDPDAEPTEESVLQSLAFGKLRIVALRQAELLRKMSREEDAVKIYNQLIAADEDDFYALKQLEKIEQGIKPDAPPLSLSQALALALNDEANILEERQSLASVLFAKGAEAPFNHFVSALRQSALILDPANSGVREIEADHLYEHGFFEASARIALTGQAKPKERADLMLSAALSFVELDKLDRVSALVEEALELEQQDGLMLLSAADLLIRADKGERAAQLAADSLKVDLPEGLTSYAYIMQSEAHFQAGDVKAAIKSAREALKVDQDDDGTREFLAAQLLNAPETRTEGIAIYRDLYIDDIDNPGMMNNFGYSLVRAPDTPAQLDEGYRILKRANRMTPFEPNLLDSLGWAYYQYGDYDRALFYIDKAVEMMAPFTHWELLDHRGDVLYRLDRTEDANAAWSEALESRPPRHRKAEIEQKISSGLKTPAPTKRAPPVVPTEEPLETNEI